MFNKRVITILFLLFTLFQPGTCSGKFEVKFLKYINPGGKGSNGNCCETPFQFLCKGSCDYRFTVCVDRNTGSDHMSYCPLGKKHTGEVSDQDNIYSFGSSIGGTPNPMVFSVTTMPSVVRLKFDIVDADDVNSWDHVDFLIHVVSSMNVAKSKEESYFRQYEFSARTSMKIAFRSYCDPNYYKKNCSVYCRPRRYPTEHYVCNKYTGDKICLPGWTGLNCSEDRDNCKGNPCNNGGTCINFQDGYSCTCKDGFEGWHCDNITSKCATDPCKNNGTCVSSSKDDFNCSCTDEWVGPTCEDPLNACYDAPCLNGGNCTLDNSVLGYTCDCDKSQWGGSKCEIQLFDFDGLSKRTEQGFVPAQYWYVWLLVPVIVVVVFAIVGTLFYLRRRRKHEMKGITASDGNLNVGFQNDSYLRMNSANLEGATQVNENSTTENQNEEPTEPYAILSLPSQPERSHDGNESPVLNARQPAVFINNNVVNTTNKMKQNYDTVTKSGGKRRGKPLRTSEVKDHVEEEMEGPNRVNENTVLKTPWQQSDTANNVAATTTNPFKSLLNEATRENPNLESTNHYDMPSERSNNENENPMLNAPWQQPDTANNVEPSTTNPFKLLLNETTTTDSTTEDPILQRTNNSDKLCARLPPEPSLCQDGYVDMRGLAGSKINENSVLNASRPLPNIPANVAATTTDPDMRPQQPLPRIPAAVSTTGNQNEDPAHIYERLSQLSGLTCCGTPLQRSGLDEHVEED